MRVTLHRAPIVTPNNFMQAIFAIIAALIVVSAIGAISFRNLVHCALSLVVTFCGVAALYLQLGAPFAGWVQVLVYVGAVAILIVFAILLTRSDENKPEPIFGNNWKAGGVIGLLLFSVMVYAITRDGLDSTPLPAKPELTVREIGVDLMTQYVIPLETMALLLTTAAIGAVIIAIRLRNPESSADSNTHAEAAGSVEATH